MLVAEGHNYGICKKCGKLHRTMALYMNIKKLTRKEYYAGWCKRNPNYHREYYLKNREKLLEQMREYRKKNIVNKKEYDRKRYLKNKSQ